MPYRECKIRVDVCITKKGLTEAPSVAIVMGILSVGKSVCEEEELIEVAKGIVKKIWSAISEEEEGEIIVDGINHPTVFLVQNRRVLEEYDT